MILFLVSINSSSDVKNISKMICHLKFTFAWILFLLQPIDGATVTWYEPTPVQTTSNPAEALIPGKLAVYEGSPATLNWNYSHSLTLTTIKLRFKGVFIVNVLPTGQVGPVNASFRQRFSVNSTPQRLSLLISKVITGDDKSNGEFSCELNDLPGATWKRAIQLQVVVPAKIHQIRGEQTVLEGGNLQLTCKASGKPEPNITWTKEKTGNQGNSVLQEGKVLTITKVSRNDSGTFNCAAYNGFGEADSQTVHVNVTYPPKIVKIKTEYFVGVKQSVTLICEAEGNPPATYSWIPCDSEQGCDKNTLHISQVLNDANYTCRVANVHGNDSKTVNVYIGGNVINITIVITSETCIDGKYNQSLLLEKLKKPLEEAFADKPGYQGVQLIGVRCGSITVDLALTFNSTTKEQDVLITLNDAVKDGKLGEFSVGAIKGTRPDVGPTSRGTPTPTDGPSEGFAWWIILIIVIIGLAAVIVLVLVVILVKKKGSCCLLVNNGKRPRVHSDEGRGIATEADNQYAAAGPNVNYRASNPSSEPSVTYEVANMGSEGRRGNKAGAPKEQLPEYAVVDKTKKKKKTPKPGELQYAELGEITGRGQKGTMPRVSGTDTVYADIKS